MKYWGFVASLGLSWVSITATAAASEPSVPLPNVTIAEDVKTALTEILDARLLPVYTPCSENGVRYACYSLEQQKELMKLEVNAKTWQTQLLLTDAALDARVAQLQLTVEQLKITEGSVQLALEHTAKLTKQLNTAIVEKNEWRAKAETPTIWPYVVGGIAGVLGVGLALGVLVSNL